MSGGSMRFRQLSQQVNKNRQLNLGLEEEQEHVYAYFRKCGEITASPDQKSFGLNCGFCPAVTAQLKVFIDHIREQHSEDLKALRTQKSEDKLEMLRGGANEHKQMYVRKRMDDVLNMHLVETVRRNDKKQEAQRAEKDTEKLVEKVNLENRREVTHEMYKVNTINTLEPDWYERAKCANPQSIGLKTQQVLSSNPKTKAATTNCPKEMHNDDEEQLNSCLVYIIEDKPLPPSLEMQIDQEEETVDPFEMFYGSNNNSDQNTNDEVTIGRVGVDWHVDVVDDWQGNKLLENSIEYDPEVKSISTKCNVNKLPLKTLETTTKAPAKDRNYKTPRMREVLRNKDIISYLLDAYKNNEKLWNPNHPNYKYNARRNIFAELSEPLLRDMNCTLSGAEIFTILKELRCRYRRDLSKFQTRNGKYKSRLWYFDKLDFLRNIIENKRAEREAKQRTENTTTTTVNIATESEQTTDSNPEPSDKTALSREVLSFLINAYKRQEMLWNTEHSGYLNCDKREYFNDVAAQLMDDLNVSLSGDECSAEMSKLRIRYRKELRILNKCKGLYIPKLWCFDQLEFLRETFEDQILKRLSKHKDIVGVKPKSTYLKADTIIFTSLEDQLTLVEIYKNYITLWDVDHPDYRSTTYRMKAFSQMLEEINTTFNLTATVDELQKTIYQLRKEFSAEKQKLLNQNVSAGLANNLLTTVAEANVIFTKLYEFLDPNLGPFRCDICNELVKTSDQYKVHKSGHDGTLPFICTLCGKGFQMPGNLTVHIRRHKRDFPYSCGVCEKRFATSTEVAIHMRTHTGERPYICDLCGKSFKTWSFFDIHRRTHLQQSNFLCPICDKAFYEKNRFTDHMNGHLNIRKHACKECGKCFTTFANLKKHNELHLEVKKYKCTSCGKRFAQFASLRWHRRTTHAHGQCEGGANEQ